MQEERLQTEKNLQEELISLYTVELIDDKNAENVIPPKHAILPKHAISSEHATTHIPVCLSRDVEKMDDGELVALILRTGGKRAGSALTQARRIFVHFENLQCLAQAGVAELSDVEGVTADKAMAISAAFELGRRWLQTPLQRGKVYTSSQDVYQAYAAKLYRYEQETFWILLLDQRNRVLRQLQIAKGSINRCPLMPQDIFAPALREKAVRMILIHNHPSGDPEPSIEDRSITRRLQHIAELMGIEILDHLVIGEQAYVSFADRGWL